MAENQAQPPDLLKKKNLEVRAVKVCAKAEIGRKSSHEKPCFSANFQ